MSRKWIVTRIWRDVEADTAVRALEKARPGKHDTSDATIRRGGEYDMALMLFQRDELGELLEAIGIAYRQHEEINQLARSEDILKISHEHLILLNSLRTAIAEARYGLMTAEEIEAEQRSLEEAKADVAQLRREVEGKRSS